MADQHGYLITWTTYGSWLPGDERGWRKRSSGEQALQPRLEQWCRERMTGNPVLLRQGDRETVEQACREHCDFRGWNLLAVNARSNHVHVVVFADASPKVVRDQLKANCTRALRQQNDALCCEKTWTRGGDCCVLPSDDATEAAVAYVLEGQDKT